MIIENILKNENEFIQVFPSLGLDIKVTFLVFIRVHKVVHISNNSPPRSKHHDRNKVCMSLLNTEGLKNLNRLTTKESDKCFP